MLRMRRALVVMMMMMMTLPLVHPSPACKNTCGDTPISYPFGTKPGCGNRLFQSYATCSKGRFILTTHTGSYEVLDIDYQNQILIVTDQKMSTCTAMRRTTSGGFGLQPGTPFTIQGPHIVLLACTSPSSLVQSSHGSICDVRGAKLCQDLYAFCPSITKLGLSVNSAIQSCCVLSMQSATPTPTSTAFELNPKSYGCLSYTSIYRFGAGQGFPTDYENPNTWSYGIPLRFEYNDASFIAGCRECEASHGSCAFDDNSTFACVCSSTLTTSGTCPPGSTSGATMASMEFSFGGTWITVLNLFLCWTHLLQCQF